MPERDEITIDLAEILTATWRARRWLLLAAVLGVAAGVAVSFGVAPKYTATATLIPQTPPQPGGLLGSLASLATLGVEAPPANEALYGQILWSDRLLDAVLAREWPAGPGGSTASMPQILGVDAGDEDERSWRTRRVLRERVVRFERDPNHGLMKVSVTLPASPAACADLANFLVAELDSFNREARARYAREHRQFLQDNLDQVAAQLAAEEERLTEFLLANTAYSSSPRLLQEYRRIDREVEAQRAIWIQLRTQLEAAKADENKHTSSLVVLDPARPPVRRSYPQRGMFGLLGLVVGLGVLGVLRLLARARTPAAPS